MSPPLPPTLLPDGLGDGMQSHNGFSQASPATRIDESQNTEPTPEVPVATPTPLAAEAASPDAEEPATGGTSAKGGGKTEPASVYEDGMYWKFPGSI